MVRLITLNGETHSVTGWAEKFGINRDTINQRLKKGWTEFDAVYTRASCKRLFVPRAETVELNDGYTMLDYIFKRNEESAELRELMSYFKLSIDQCREIYDRIYNLDIDDIGRLI